MSVNSSDIILSTLQSPLLNSEGVFQKLADAVNDMILHDFPGLIQLLYRVDVNEKKLKQALANNSNENAGKIIAQLLIQRQLQKEAIKQKFKQEQDIDEDEKW
ncbi:hypothetical protein ACI6Q2_04915 [Chitinophagaceae bacterium LWZ2-11]